MRVTALVFCLAAMLSFTASARADKVDWSDFIDKSPPKQPAKAAPAQPAKVARAQTARPAPKRAAQPAKPTAKKTLPKPRARR